MREKKLAYFTKESQGKYIKSVWQVHFTGNFAAECGEDYISWRTTTFTPVFSRRLCQAWHGM